MDDILARIVAPTFPERDYDVTEFGAVGNGRTDNHPAFVRAIAARLDKEKVAKVKKGLGEWQTYRLVVKGDRAEAYLNGELVCTAEGLKVNKQAYLGLQAEGGEQAFRNLRVRPLKADGDK